MSNRHGSMSDEARQRETAEIIQQLRECTDDDERPACVNASSW